MAKYNFGVALFDDFVKTCPYFIGDLGNNGYGCSYPDQITKCEPEEDLDETGFNAVIYGKCRCQTCLFGKKLDADDLFREDIFWNGQSPDFESSDDLLLIPLTEEADAKGIEIDAWVRYQKYLNRDNPKWKREDALKPF